MRTLRNLILLAFVGIAPALIATAFMTGARAQMILSDDNVTVDLSVLEGGGSVAEPRGLPPTAEFRGLLVPGLKFPVSTLHIPSAPGTVSPGTSKKAGKRRLIKTTAPPAQAARKPQPPAIPVEKVRAEPLKIAKPAVVKKPAVTKKPVVVKKIEEPKKILPPPPPPPPPPLAPAVTPKTTKAPPSIQQQASLPDAGLLLKLGKFLHVEFKPTASKLPTKAKEQLKVLADGLTKNKNLRLQLRAHAGGKSVSPIQARRLSLSRALSVRSFLIENGIRSTRIDVRALGNKTAEKPVNRVDVNITER